MNVKTQPTHTQGPPKKNAERERGKKRDKYVKVSVLDKSGIGRENERKKREKHAFQSSTHARRERARKKARTCEARVEKRTAANRFVWVRKAREGEKKYEVRQHSNNNKRQRRCASFKVASLF